MGIENKKLGSYGIGVYFYLDYFKAFAGVLFTMCLIVNYTMYMNYTMDNNYIYNSGVFYNTIKKLMLGSLMEFDPSGLLTPN